MPEPDELTKDEPRETYSYTLPPRVATQVAIYAAETGQNKSRALQEIIESGIATARAKRAVEGLAA
jgi:predicted DNA-binding protein